MSPTMETVPRVGLMSPPTMPSNVDLPQPEGPTMATISPWRMVKPMSSRTDRGPYWWLTAAATSSKAMRGCSGGRPPCRRLLLEQKADIPGQDLLARRSQRANVLHEVADHLARTDLLRIIGGEHDAGSRDFHQRGFHRPDRAAEAGGVEHQVVREIVVEVLRGLHAVTRVCGGTPELLVLVAADASQHRCNPAAEMRHMHGEVGVTIEHAGIDQPDGRHDQRELAPDRACRVVPVELLRVIELERRVHEHEHAEPGGLGPERLERRRIEEQAVGLRRDDHAVETELVATPREFAQRRRPAE